MIKKLNSIEKKLKFHCSVCFTVYQLVEVQQSLKSNKDNKCLNDCGKRWKARLTEYCQEQIILDLARQEQQKDEQAQDLTKWLNEIKKQSENK